MWVLIDNYDSFTYILHHYLLQLHKEVVVFKNDEVSVEALNELPVERFILSPGPRTPNEAGITLDVIKHFYKTHPILGICLGHQALGVFLGADLVKASYPMHGKTSEIRHTETGIFKSLPNPLVAMRYHSLVLSKWQQTLIKPLAISADDQALMAFEHSVYPLLGMQFHPESILTPNGFQLLQNWAKSYR